MRHALITAAIVMAFAAVSRAQDASLTVLTPQSDLGSLTPGSAQPSIALLSFNVVSGTPWRIALRIDRNRPRAVATSAEAAERSLLLRTASGGMRTEISPNLPATVLEGMPTPKGGTIVTVPLEAEALWSAAPHRDAIRLEVLLNEQPVAGAIDCSFEIAPRIDVVADSRPYRLQVADPTHVDTMWFEPRTYHVTSNTPWALSVKLKDEVRLPGTNRLLDSKAFVVKTAAGNGVSLDDGSVVASGSPTGERGVDVEVNLGLRLNANEIGGAYAGSIIVDVVPVVGALSR